MKPRMPDVTKTVTASLTVCRRRGMTDNAALNLIADIAHQIIITNDQITNGPMLWLIDVHSEAVRRLAPSAPPRPPQLAPPGAASESSAAGQ
jgi:hypothetical protein